MVGTNPILHKAQPKGKHRKYKKWGVKKDELPEAWFVVDDNIVNSLQVGKRERKINRQ